MTDPQKQLLIFDLDGTLIDSVPDIAIAVNKAFLRLNKETFNEEQIRNWVGNGSLKLIERALQADISSDDKLTPESLEHTHQLFLDKYSQTCANVTKPYPYVDEGLRELKKQGYTLTLMTNKPIRFVPDILAKFGWSDVFEVVLGGDSLEKKKPDPLPLLHICKQLNFDATQSIMIGDSKNDVYAGQRANMDTIGLSYGYNYGKHISDYNPSYVFDEFKEMVEFLLGSV